MLFPELYLSGWHNFFNMLYIYHAGYGKEPLLLVVSGVIT